MAIQPDGHLPPGPPRSRTETGPRTRGDKGTGHARHARNALWGGRGRTVLGAGLALAGAAYGMGTALGLPVTGSTSTSTSTSASAPADDDGGVRAYDVTDYDVKVSYDPQSSRLEGDTEIAVRATADLERFDLDLALTARSVDIDGKPAQSFEASDDGSLGVVPEEKIEKGRTFTVRVRYDGEPGQDNPSWVKGEDGGVVTVMAPVGTWFPGNGDPDDTADFRLSATVPDGWTAVSGGRDRPVEHHGGRSTFDWRSTRPLAAKDALFGVGKWDVERTELSDGTPLTTVYGAGRKDEFKKYAGQQRKIMDFLTSKYGAYPYDTLVSYFLDSVSEEAPNLAVQGGVIFPNAENEEYFDATVVAHELTHQWYGSLVKEKEQRNLCLSECFASYAQWMWPEFSEGQDLDARYRQEIEKHPSDDELWQQRLSEGQGVYDKGPLMLHALRKQIGEAAFAEVLKQWPAEYGGKAPEWADMEKLVQKVSGQDLRGFFDAWAHGDSIPGDAYLRPGD
ncbi:M1 family aminopeptidase [Streptomyces mayonensis]|uniref:M1 family aminopeptidase n=1 Tax=Streptomyces mayonensis TaxID=2750816 RepID=UPI001C1E5F6E|nr:M1 family aminopeptidase [Streptomyces sp. A108]MBU6534564.1 M1 family peptidase [Streptomyces sp. A108]